MNKQVFVYVPWFGLDDSRMVGINKVVEFWASCTDTHASLPYQRQVWQKIYVNGKTDYLGTQHRKCVDIISTPAGSCTHHTSLD